MIQEIYLFVSEDLSLKDKSGYSSNDEFNRALNYAENLLFSFYMEKYEQNNLISDSLSPFIVKNTSLAITSGTGTLPTDYRHRIDLMFNKIENDDCEAYYTKISASPIGSNEEGIITDSVLRRPSVEKKKVYYFIEGDSIRVLPELTGTVTFKYLRSPDFGNRVVTYDEDAVDEVYDEESTTDLEWEEQDRQNLINILLFLKGVQIRDSELLQFLGTRKAALND